MSDSLKVHFPPDERPDTSVSIWWVLTLSIIVTVLVFVAVAPFERTFARDMLMGMTGINMERVIFQGLVIWMWQMSFINVMLKFSRLKKETKMIKLDFIPKDLDFRNIPALMEVHQKILEHPQLSKSVAMTRMGRLLAMWINTEDTERTLNYGRMESEMDIFVSDSSYRANRLYIWAMPLLGFVGTVFGVSAGIGGFAEFLRGQVTSEEIQYQVGLITEGLAVAFYCTLLGLMTAGFAAFPSLMSEKTEEAMIAELDQYVEDRLLSRLPSVRKVEFPMDDIQALRKSVEAMQVNFVPTDLIRAIQGMKLNVATDGLGNSIKEGMQDLRLNVMMPMEDLSRAIDEGFRRLPNPDNYVTVFSRAISEASGLVNKKYEEFASSYEHRIGELGSSFASQLDGVAVNIRSGSNDVSAQMKEQTTALITQFGSAMKQMSSATDAYTQRVDETSKTLGAQVDRVTELAMQIDSMLKATKSMEAALGNLSSSEHIVQTLNSMRTHLDVSDEFLKRMSKPRRIELRDEPFKEPS